MSIDNILSSNPFECSSISLKFAKLSSYTNGSSSSLPAQSFKSLNLFQITAQAPIMLNDVSILVYIPTFKMLNFFFQAPNVRSMIFFVLICEVLYLRSFEVFGLSNGVIK